MRPDTGHVSVPGPAGALECAIDAPAGAPAGIALVAHPHPLFGGTLDNKVAQTLAKAFVDLGHVALRPNFRGVGESAGKHDEGRGEVDDLGAVLAYAHRKWGGELPVALAGFSFGAAMQVLLAARLAAAGTPPKHLALVGLGLGRVELPAAAGALVIHGEKDDTVPLAAVLDWARPQDLPVVVVPGADHFFHRKLQVLRRLVRVHCR